ncbi:MAG TPA: hypothetical protein DHV33_02385 [Candidatus Moranbacteria bacterium]|nr:hypothetical protein [Candidatus Moranbacteria bacterium]
MYIEPFKKKYMNEDKQKIIIALRKAKTSIEKIISRIDNEESECFPALQQTLSAIGLLRSVNILMLESHMKREMGKYKGASTKQMQTLQEEILKIVKTSQNK